MNIKQYRRGFLRRLFKTQVSHSVWGDALNILVLTVLGALMAVPLVFVISNAFKPIDELFLSPPRFWVMNPTLDNIKDLINIMNNSWVPISRYIFNTLFVTITGTAAHVIFASMAAYVLEKHNFYGRKAFFAVVVMTLMFSPTVTSIPNFIIMSKLHLVDTPLALIIPAIGSSLGLFLMKQFMTSVPNAVIEAARIDGSGECRIFFSIIMPSVKPAWLTLIIFSSQNLWNTTGGVLIRTENLKPLPYALNQISAGGFARTGAASAIGLFLMIVPITIFVLAQGNIINTMSASGIKE